MLILFVILFPEDRVVQTTRTETRQIGWYDPLAQSFIHEEEGGVFVSAVEIFFNTKDDNIPISMQIRTMENGYPTKTILPFSDVTITPDQVELSETAAVPTKFTFRAPVYLKASVEYCFVLLSDSNEYQVWISRMGDVDVSGEQNYLRTTLCWCSVQITERIYLDCRPV